MCREKASSKLGTFIVKFMFNKILPTNSFLCVVVQFIKECVYLQALILSDNNSR